VSAELEGRIKASLSAYADLVEEPEDVPLPTRRRPAEPVVRRWRAPLLVAAAVASAVTIGVSVWPASSPGGDSAATSVADGGGAEAADSGGEAGAGQEERGEGSDDAAVSATEVLPPFEIGVPVAFDLYTHCGVLGAVIDGVWFAAQPPLVEGAGNPPTGWDNPYQAGTLTLLTADEAVFSDDAGHEVRLFAAPDETPPPCD
jgi:hypothetical protein